MTNYSYRDSLDGWDWERIPADADAVVRRWWAMVHHRLPWRAMPIDDGFGYIRPVVSELLNEARHPSDGVRELRLDRAARAHGAFRRRQHCSSAALAEEIIALGASIKAILLDAGQPPAVVRDYLVLLDVDVRAACELAVGGWRAGDQSVSLSP